MIGLNNNHRPSKYFLLKRQKYKYNSKHSLKSIIALFYPPIKERKKDTDNNRHLNQLSTFPEQHTPIKKIHHVRFSSLSW